ncbi:MAG: hypothetical protein GXP46_12960 [Deferribacteres bacterium]|nr:hypothetical protein [Deferribacteres bacterium]
MIERAISRKPQSREKVSSPKIKRADSNPAHILHLHQTLGNRAVQRLFASGVIQPKLKIGRSGDIYEQEADRVAEQVMSMPEPAIQPT